MTAGSQRHGPFGHDFGELIDVLGGFRGERVVYVPNGGNAGDSLIQLGCHRILETAGLDYEMGDLKADYPGRVVILAGGGNLVPYYKEMSRFLARNGATAAALLLLPHTVRAYPELLAALDARATLVARELPTLDYLRAHAPSAHVLLGHDLAFFVDIDGRDAAPAFGAADLRLRNLRRHLVRQIRMARLARARLAGDDVLQAFRTDVEGVDRSLPIPNFDLSRLFAADDMSLYSCLTTTAYLARAVRAHRLVRSDRLHVAIIGALAGVEVDMHDNVYGKNRSIFDHSIKDYFERVRFSDEPLQGSRFAPI